MGYRGAWGWGLGGLGWGGAGNTGGWVGWRVGWGWGGAFYSRDRKSFHCVHICTCTCVYACVRVASIAADVTRKTSISWFSSGCWMPICFEIRVGQAFWEKMVWTSLYAFQTTHNSRRKQHFFSSCLWLLCWYAQTLEKHHIDPCEYSRPCIAQLIILCKFSTDVSKRTNSDQQ